MEFENAAADILLEFLEVAIHNIIYIRHIYPSSIFERRKKYGVPVQMSIHPHLNEYITECLKTIKELLKKNEVRRVTVVFSDKHRTPVEIFVFDILDLNRNFQIESDPYLLRVEEAFRGFCLRLSVTGTQLKPLPEDSTFSVQIHTIETASVSLAEDHNFENFPWIEADLRETEVMEPSIMPIKTMETGYVKLQMYVEESVIK